MQNANKKIKDRTIYINGDFSYETVAFREEFQKEVKLLLSEGEIVNLKDRPLLVEIRMTVITDIILVLIMSLEIFYGVNIAFKFDL